VSDHRVAFDDLGGVGYVSTIRQAPGWYETAGRIGPEYDIDVQRTSSTYAEAIGAHYALVAEHNRRLKDRDK
jgi:hypothetical protein